MAALYDLAVSVLTSPKHTRWVAPLLVLADAVLCTGIVSRVSYTEIDWETYMIQVSKFLQPNWETNYSKLKGPTGPLVYPAIHLWIHSALYYITDHGKDIKLAQIIYAGLYLSTLALVLACYRRVNAPPWLLLPLVLSKRLHSIFLLRLFNDCWATFFFWLSVYGATRQRWSLMVLGWTIALGVKMTMLLPLPALGAILVQGAGMDVAVFWGILSFMIQFGSAFPFMGKKETPIYLKQAFDLGRQFMYKWTVNWKFVPKDLFLAKPFAYGLLLLHAGALFLFLNYQWVRPSSGSLLHFIKKHLNYANIKGLEQDRIASRLTPKFVMDTLLGSIVIGMMCARSLHYQFYAYLGWITPYILWSAGSRPVLVLGTWALQEYAWLVYPATSWSSATVLFLLSLQVGSSWSSFPPIYPPTLSTTRAGEDKKAK